MLHAKMKRLLAFVLCAALLVGLGLPGIAVTAQAEKVGDNLLANPGFEPAAAEGIPGWTAVVNKASTEAGATAKVVALTGDMANGHSSALCLHDTGEKITAGAYSDAFAVTPGSTFTFTGDYYLVGEGTLNFQLQFTMDGENWYNRLYTDEKGSYTDASGKYYNDVDKNYPGGGSRPSASSELTHQYFVQDTGETTAWKSATITDVVPDGATHARINMATVNAGAVDAYCDNFKYSEAVTTVSGTVEPVFTDLDFENSAIGDWNTSSTSPKQTGVWFSKGNGNNGGALQVSVTTAEAAGITSNNSGNILYFKDLLGTTENGGTGTNGSPTVYTSELVEIKAGQTITISADVYKVSDGGHQTRFWAYFFKDDGTILSGLSGGQVKSGKHAIDIYTQAVEGKWETITRDVSTDIAVGEGATKVGLAIVGASKTTCEYYFDNLEIKVDGKVPTKGATTETTTTTDAVITNSDFETAAATGTPGWTITGDAEYTNGSLCLKPGAVVESDPISVTGGENYLFQTASNGDGRNYKLVYVDAAGAEIAEQGAGYHTAPSAAAKAFVRIKNTTEDVEQFYAEARVFDVTPFHMDGYSATLSDSIGLNFHYVLSDTFRAANETASIALPNGTKQTVTVGDASKFTANVAAKELTKDITVTIGDNAETYTVKAYLNSIEDGSYYKAVANALLNYGAAAQVHFGYNTDALANDAYLDAVSAVTAADVASFVHTVTKTEDTSVTYKSGNLNTISKTELRLGFALAEDANIADYTFKVDGEKLDYTANAGRYYVDIKGIAPGNLDKVYTVTVEKADAVVLTVEYSPMSYVYSVLNKYGESGTNEAWCNLVRALYLYQVEANKVK